MPIKRICFLTDHHISMNPRVWKEALFYEQLGHEVSILTMWANSERLALDLDILKNSSIKYVSYLNLVDGSLSGFKRFFFRARLKLAVFAFRLTGIDNRWCVTYAPGLLYWKAKKQNVDLYIAHLEAGFYAGVKLAGKGFKVGFDFEDWYSRDYLVAGRPTQLLQDLEEKALKMGVFCTTTSKGLKEALVKANGVQAESVKVIYNGFSTFEGSERKKQDHRGVPKFIWFSRTVGKGRGLENLIENLSYFTGPFELHLLGDISNAYKSELVEFYGSKNLTGLFFHNFIPHNEIITFLQQFDIGFATEEITFDSRNYTITNKILQYLQAGLGVIATDTIGQREVANLLPESVLIVDTNPNKWIRAIEVLLQRDQQSKSQSIIHFNKHFSWESQTDKLEKIINQI